MNSVITIIDKYTKQFNLNYSHVCGIVKTESNFDPFAYRYETNYSYLFKVSTFAQKLNITENSEKILQKSSYGLMQIMGAVARERGFEGQLLQLVDPDINIYYGCKHLKWYSDNYKYKDTDLISAYNQGKVRYRNSEYANQDYVNKVLKNAEIFRLH